MLRRDGMLGVNIRARCADLAMNGIEHESFLSAYRGRLVSVLRWPQLEDLWEQVRTDAESGWYIYAVGEGVPDAPCTRAQVFTFIAEVDELLRREHREDFCGIVYADDLENPALIKIYDPKNLGVVCGYSDSPPLPAWVMSKFPPSDLRAEMPPAGNRRRWWRRLFGS
jgi:hypothetical protein